MKEPPLSTPAKSFIAVVVIIGLATFVSAGLNWPHSDWARFTFYLAVAALASRLKVRLPGMEATISVSFFFSLLTAAELGYSGAIAVAGVSGLMQSTWKSAHRVQRIQIPFNISVLAISSAAAAVVFQSPWIRGLGLEFMARVALATAALFLMNIVPVSCIVALTQGKGLWPTLSGFGWTLPYYLAAAALVSVFHAISLYVGWQSSLLSMPALYLVYRSFQFYLDRVEAHRLHAEQLSALHMRTIEALALAIEAKDQSTVEHLGRVQVYALAVGKELGLDHAEMEALRTASLLHDIGKLAVPEHIISKPGRLTPEEFEKMKIHPSVGAEILETVQFPYPVAPIVRWHHEKWDGTGYPDGLKAEAIPIGARIIAAVDCLDALASDRQYRRALPMDEAMKVVREESGRAFDPKVVEILDRRYCEFELQARQQARHSAAKRPFDTKVNRGGAPGAGFERTDAKPGSPLTPSETLAIQTAAWAELSKLLENIQQLGPILCLEELVALLAIRLRNIVPYSGLAAYVASDGALTPLYVIGEDAKLFCALRIPVGQGLSGWVAETRKPVVNGNPSVEPGYLGDATKFSANRSAISVPVESSDGCLVCVVTLYSLSKDAYSMDDLCILQTIAANLSLAVENSGSKCSADLLRLDAEEQSTDLLRAALKDDLCTPMVSAIRVT